MLFIMSRPEVGKLSVKGQRVNVLGFAVHAVSVAIIVDPWTMWGLGVPTPNAIENMHYNFWITKNLTIKSLLLNGNYTDNIKLMNTFCILNVLYTVFSK